MSGSKGLVLVVEDESSLADLLRLYLSREVFGVHVETDGTGFGLALFGRLASRLGASATAGAATEGGAVFSLDLAASRVPLN